jgi:hypothetical protein
LTKRRKLWDEEERKKHWLWVLTDQEFAARYGHMDIDWKPFLEYLLELGMQSLQAKHAADSETCYTTL